MKIGFARTLLWACISVQAVMFVLAWTDFESALGAIVVQLTDTGISSAAKLAMTPAQRAVGAAVGLPALLVLTYGLWRLDRLLLNFHRLDLFTAESIGHLRMFAGATLLATGLSILELPIRSVALCAMQRGQCEVMMKFNSEQLMMMLVCALFYLITRLMQEGRRLAEENESFI